MKEGIHPNYRDVIFKDISCDFAFKSKSTAKSNETIKWEDGKDYPVIKLEISSASHPFFTDKAKVIMTAGRVDKFKKEIQDEIKTLLSSVLKWFLPQRHGVTESIESFILRNL